MTVRVSVIRVQKGGVHPTPEPRKDDYTEASTDESRIPGTPTGL